LTAVLLTKDLMFSSKAAAAGQRTGTPVATALSVDALDERLAQGDVRLVLLDLASLSVSPAVLIEKLRAGHGARAFLVAFGPHVHEDLLAAAQLAGCDLVMTRGQFNAQLDEVLRMYG
jgi:hypothetical protein